MMSGMRTLVAYFSRSGDNYVNGSIANLPIGNTEVAAKMVQKLTGGDTFRIDTVKKYPVGDSETTDVARQELGQNARPELSGYLDSIDDYSVILLGYPNWWARRRKT